MDRLPPRDRKKTPRYFSFPCGAATPESWIGKVVGPRGRAWKKMKLSTAGYPRRNFCKPLVWRAEIFCNTAVIKRFPRFSNRSGGQCFFPCLHQDEGRRWAICLRNKLEAIIESLNRQSCVRGDLDGSSQNAWEIAQGWRSVEQFLEKKIERLCCRQGPRGTRNLCIGFVMLSHKRDAS